MHRHYIMQSNGNRLQDQGNSSKLIINTLQDQLQFNNLQLDDLEVLLQAKQSEVGELQRFLLQEFQQIENAQRTNRRLKTILTSHILPTVSRLKEMINTIQTLIPSLLLSVYNQLTQSVHKILNYRLQEQEQKKNAIKSKDQLIATLHHKIKLITQTQAENQKKIERLIQVQRNCTYQSQYTQTLQYKYQHILHTDHTDHTEHTDPSLIKRTHVYSPKQYERENSQHTAKRIKHIESQNEEEKRSVRMKNQNVLHEKIRQIYWPAMPIHQNQQRKNERDASTTQKISISSSNANIHSNRLSVVQIPKNQAQYYGISPKSKDTEKKKSVKKIGQQLRKNLQLSYQKNQKIDHLLCNKHEEEQPFEKYHEKIGVRREEVKKKIERLRYKENNI